MTVNGSRVFVVDDDDSVCRALARLIQSAGYGVETFGSARAFLGRVCTVNTPACAVLDVQLPDLSGLELQRELNAALPVIFVTGHGDIPMTVGAMKAGATDFLSKPVQDADLLRAIGQALERAAQTHAIRCEVDALRRRVDRLTPREREVMELVVEGRLNKQVASELGTAEQTIKIHRGRVMAKMEVASLAELVRIADKIGLGAPAEPPASR
ncbi:response regulator transcription factor [Paraburkholderia dipogonis]|uniref:response regulator transcription factor n=1 Tax=Paraburkholderia dipogonis TaxID=1211383 RepID=UPI0038BCFB8E